MDSSAALSGTLSPRLIRKPEPHKARSLRIPGIGRVIVTRDPGSALITGRDAMESHLFAVHRDGEGKVKDCYDLGSGNIQSNFTSFLAQDQVGTTSNKAAPVLANSGGYMYSGTGSTVNTYDYQLQTTAGPASGAVTPTLGWAANGTAGTDATLQYVGTISYTSTLAITEWGLFSTNSQGAAYSASSFSTVSTTTVTPTTNPSWTANQWAGSGKSYVAVDTSAATKVAAVILSNSSTSLTVAGWYKLASSGGSGTTPATTDTIGIYPLMTDHKTFSVINVVNGDSIQFTYTLTLVSGG